MCGVSLGFLYCSIVIYFLFLCHCHTVLMTITLLYSLKSGRSSAPDPFFFLKNALLIQDILCFHTNCIFVAVVLILLEMPLLF